MKYKPLPIDVDDFGKIIEKGYYYADKTLMIRELLDKKGDVNLFTRPRRFGKTLNLSMLKYYFENTGNLEQNQKNSELFSGLAIMKAGTEYTREMTQYPVIMLTLKSARQSSYDVAFHCLKEAIAAEFARHEKMVTGRLSHPQNEEKYSKICGRQGDDSDFFTSLAFLSECLYQVYGRKTIILIDEYDVPLENAYFTGFYDKMAGFIRSLFESALKTNPYLEFAVITGCLRISRESIFTGLNNLGVYSILNGNYSSRFGFVEKEVQEILTYYEKTDHQEELKKWYDGYCFGETEIYNPWSILCYTQDILAGPAFPKPYWANTSSNSIVKSLVERIDDEKEQTQEQLEYLMNGGTIEKPIHEDITYDNIYDSDDNLWNFLFFTGYLKKTSVRKEGRNTFLTMAVPNEEVAYIYENTISIWFEKKQREFDMSPLFTAMEEGDTDLMEEEISGFLAKTISYFDYGEAYYHGFLSGLLQMNRKYRILSNREAGLGRTDIILKTPRIRNGRAIVIELKAVKKFSVLENGCEEAVQQIEKKKYKEELSEEGYKNILAYGICFFQKECMVYAANEEY